LYEGRTDLFPQRAKALLEQHDLLISPMVVLELEYLREIGRVSVEAPVIVEYLESAIALRVCPLPFHRVVMEALDTEWTRDPFDRLIVAQAAAAQSSLLTKDAVIRANVPELAAWD
jgi:PIN domain nuclease of toxin-antitoxin system